MSTDFNRMTGSHRQHQMRLLASKIYGCLIKFPSHIFRIFFVLILHVSSSFAMHLVPDSQALGSITTSSLWLKTICNTRSCEVIYSDLVAIVEEIPEDRPLWGCLILRYLPLNVVTSYFHFPSRQDNTVYVHFQGLRWNLQMRKLQ